MSNIANFTRDEMIAYVDALDAEFQAAVDNGTILQVTLDKKDAVMAMRSNPHCREVTAGHPVGSSRRSKNISPGIVQPHRPRRSPPASFHHQGETGGPPGQTS
ncbi:hypothetical protein HYPSUDRAFT_201482 [Hypholoma sublateritium FD-334 SS-4]|uniref:Uncharacterized protein n=1 Tax=Hypholoma sublateritium (strain FD-334 SS-4) TaxID=945553 RepID=A0A0D2NXF5_HYPSF|nr:hypothetical protein HYPSUDRAFT_201482 [Hypholoma sublateritium FD-334 SS-4]